MSDGEKALEMPVKKNDNDKKPKKKTKKSLGWIIGVVVLILISLTFLLPSTMFYGDSSSSISFGKYNGNSIELTYDSYFYFQLQNYYNYYVNQYGTDVANNYSYNIYYSAYQSALVHEALKEKAEAAGIKATSKSVSDAVVESGFYSDGEASFSQEIYNQATDMQHKQIVSWMKDSLPTDEVINNYASAKVSKSETEFISSLSDGVRNFEYIALTGEMYPDEDAAAYIESHKDLFQYVGFTRATYATTEEATAALEAIAKGTKTMEEAVAESVDSSTSEGGKISMIYRYALDNYLASTSPDSSAEVFAAEKGTIVGPIYTSEGYSLYLIDQAATDPDTTDSTTLYAAKLYVTQYDNEVMKAFLEGKAAEVFAEAKVDFEAAADKYGLTINTVSSSAENPGDSQYIASFNYSDASYTSTGSITNGYLYTAVTADSSFSDKLFSSDYGTVLDPVYASNAYIIVRPMEATGSTSYLSSMISSMYSSYVPSQSLSDYQNTVINSDKVEDNFISGFLSAAYGSQTSK
ncbi:MAG: peptidyl-prolyl cis-trans isomerase [Spirochaetales bacterium]|nr:peptidyl-prolyl cis-trans isomerase [Spirochaetales bacterium]